MHNLKKIINVYTKTKRNIGRLLFLAFSVDHSNAYIYIKLFTFSAAQIKHNNLMAHPLLNSFLFLCLAAVLVLDGHCHEDNKVSYLSLLFTHESSCRNMKEKHAHITYYTYTFFLSSYR